MDTNAKKIELTAQSNLLYPTETSLKTKKGRILVAEYALLAYRREWKIMT